MDDEIPETPDPDEQRVVDKAKIAEMRRWRADQENLEAWQRAELELADEEFGDRWWLNESDVAFDRGLVALDSFNALEGHARVPNRHVEYGIGLGQWVSDRRKAFRTGKLSPQHVTDLESRAGWVWNQVESRYRDAIALLDEFIAREGHASVPQFHLERSFKLGQWVSSRRVERAQGILSGSRALELDTKTGWSWSAFESNYARALASLDSYESREGDCLVPAKHVERDFTLGVWVSARRSEYKRGVLSAQRIADLESRTGWSWSPMTLGTQRWLEALDNFSSREGHSDVSHEHFEDGLALGKWVSHQRDRFKRGILDAGEAHSLASRAGWIWDHKSASMERHLAAVDSYALREGHALVPGGHVEDGLNLGQWTVHQRQKYRHGDLDVATANALESARGWSWNVSEDAFESGLRTLDAFVKREGHSAVPQGHMEDGFSLGTWVNNRRKDRRMGRLDSVRQAALEARIGWEWELLDGRYAARLRALDAFVEREGHALVKGIHVEDGIALGTWVIARRRDFWEGKLSPERIADLNSRTGWSWSPMDDQFDNGLAYLDAFIEREGHTIVPHAHFEGGFTLGTWARTRRLDFSLGKLSPERIADLNSRAGWVWEVLDNRFAEGLASLDAFIEREGHARVPKRHVEGGFPLGSWVCSRRIDFLASKLSSERIADLNRLSGWTWEPLADQFAEGLASLDAFIEREGHARVLNKHLEDGFALGAWVSSRRTAFRRGTLSQPRISELNARSGWVWTAGVVPPLRRA